MARRDRLSFATVWTLLLAFCLLAWFGIAMLGLELLRLCGVTL